MLIVFAKQFFCFVVFVVVVVVYSLTLETLMKRIRAGTGFFYDVELLLDWAQNAAEAVQV